MAKYSVTFQADAVGTVDVTQEGLYYCFCCRCTTPDDEVYKLYADCGTQTHDLGILVPDGKFVSTQKRIPHKAFASDNWNFYIVPRATTANKRCEILDCDHPCSLLKDVHKARLERDSGKYYVVV